ncbi:MAG: hypothetical protein ABI646_10320, partial [Acidobacteriota bacterium]
ETVGSFLSLCDINPPAALQIFRKSMDDGTIVTLRSAIAKHFVASMTTLETAATNRVARLQDYAEFRRKGMDESRTERMKRIVIDPANDPVKAAELIEILLRMKIEVRVSTSAFSSTRAHAYEKDSAVTTKRCSAVCYVIDLNQPQKRLIKALLEPDTPQDDAFVQDEIAKFKRNEMRGKSASREDYRFYDITAWSLPLAFGLDAFWTEDSGAISATPVTQQTLASMKGGSVSGRAQIAYIIPYDTDGAGAMAIRLLQQGHRVAVSTKKLTAGGRTFARGSFVVRISRNANTIHDAIARLAAETGTTVVAVNSGYNEEGDTGVGSENVQPMQMPKIGIIADEVVDQTSYGSIWWTLDRYGIEFTPITLANARGSVLNKFNVLIMPDGAAGRYFSSLGAGGVAGLKTWISSGGTLVTVRGASVFAALKDVGLTSSKLVGSDDEEEKGKTGADDTDKRKDAEAKPTPTPKGTPSTDTAEPVATPEPKTDKQDWQAPVLPPIASPSANAGKVPEGIPGAIMRATVDRTTYLTYGLNQDELPVLLSSGYFFRYSKEGTNALVFDAKPKRPLTLSGFVWEGNTERLLKGTAYLIDEPLGSGHVILFADEPFFRGIFRSTTRPFFNSILFNGVF